MPQIFVQHFHQQVGTSHDVFFFTVSFVVKQLLTVFCLYTEQLQQRLPTVHKTFFVPTFAATNVSVLKYMSMEHIYTTIFCLYLTESCRCCFYCLILLNKVDKTNTELFMVVHKSALIPIANTAKPLMLGSHTT